MRSLISFGLPPMLTSSSLSVSVTTLEFSSASSTLRRSFLDSFKAKKCCAFWILFGFLMHPSVLPALRSNSLLATPGHDGVVTCTTTPSPSSFQATTPFEWPHDPPQLLALQACTFGSW